MAVPKRRKSSRKRDQRRAQHDKVTPVQSVNCPSCGEIALPHRACRFCGWYKNRVVIAVKANG
ncbi:MAG TPA: 50S ribosomal protein L32 [Sorangium sp.]|nr:50S ribosomal protein L32 [Sorangium sp.]